jgi:glycosyltransferase involved in cell wall biosynthesis
MKGIQVLGVTNINDSYPNIKYKLAALQHLLGDTYSEYLMPLNKSTTSQGLFSELRSRRLALFWRFFIGHIKVFFYSLRNRAESVYVCYPGIFITLWLGLPFVRKRFPVTYLDAFISLYDTVVLDRRILKEHGLLAKALYRLERRAFKHATVVVVDTPENASFYSQLFGLPLDKFYAMPLCIPPLLANAGEPQDHDASASLRCVFVGTFVPLQGIRTIIEAASLLEDQAGIDIVFIGDGQDGEYLEKYLEKSQNERVTWHRGHYPTEFIVEQIGDADICLGIFGKGQKAQRVLPYKIYYYLTLGRPVITAATDTTARILTECKNLDIHEPFILVPAGDGQALAKTLIQLRDSPENRSRIGASGAEYFRRALSASAIEQSLRQLITRASQSNKSDTVE